MTNLHRIMSSNINAITGYGEGDNSWAARAPLALSIINRYKADLIGLQEMLPANFDTFPQSRIPKPTWDISFRTWDFSGRFTICHLLQCP